MSIETELSALREAVEALTAAITGHAETRLRIFDRAYDDAEKAIPIDPARIAAEINAESAPFDVFGFEEATPAPETTTAGAAGTKAANDEPAPAAVSSEEVRALALDLVKRSGRDAVQTLLVDGFGVGRLPDLNDAQRVEFAARVAGLLQAAA